MKNKDFLKSSLKRILCVILCTILLFTCSLTAFAFDGQGTPPIPESTLKEHLTEANVFYNSRNTSIMSPFNKEVLYWLLKWPVLHGAENFIMSDYEYFAVTRYASGLNQTYFVIPEINTDKMLDFSLSILVGDLEYPQFYANMITSSLNNFVETQANYLDGSKFNCLKADSFTKTDLWDALFNKVDEFYGSYYLAYVYCVSYTDDGNITNVSEVKYCDNYFDAFEYLPVSNITQLYYHSSYDTNLDGFIDLGGTIYTNDEVKTANLNNWVSTSTYSVNFYDDFGIEGESLSFYSSTDIYFSVGNPSSVVFELPEKVRGPSYDTSTKVSISSLVSEGSEGLVSTDYPFLIMGYSKSGGGSGKLTFVFTEAKEPIIYIRVSGARATYFQLISKVDYEVYYGSELIGIFDGETTTYECIKSYADVYNNPIIYGANNTSLTTGDKVVCYPSIMHSYGAYRQDYPAVYLGDFYGYSSVMSILPDTQSLGYYTYVSPNISESVLTNGSSSPITNPNGTHGTPGVNPDDWDFTVDLDSVRPELWEFEMTEYPDFSEIFEIEVVDIWQIPENFVAYLLAITTWTTENLANFCSKYAEPVYKVFLVGSETFELLPDWFTFLIILSIVILLGLKILQYSVSSMDILSDSVESTVHYGAVSGNRMAANRDKASRQAERERYRQQRANYQRAQAEWNKEARAYREKRMEVYKAQLDYYKNKKGGGK